MTAADIILHSSDENGIIKTVLAETIERMTYSQCQAFAEEILQLDQHRIATKGLWATNEPHRISDPYQLLTEIK